MQISTILSRGRSLFAIGAVVGGIATPATLWSQARSLSWTETTQMEIPGTLGAILGMFGGSEPSATRSAMHLQGRALIQETDQTAVVIDLDGGRWITADHEARMVMTANFEQMGELSSEVAGISANATSEAVADSIRAARADLDQALEDARAEMEFRVTAESTGERQQIGGYNASRHIVVAEFEASAMPEGVEERQGGSIYIIADLWQTDAVAGEDAIYAEWAQMVASDPAFRGSVEGLTADLDESENGLAAGLAAWDPAIAAGMEELAAEMSEIDGTTLRSVVTVAAVPQGLQVDREALLTWEPATMGGQLRGAVAGAARQAAGDAARSAIRGLAGGLFGGGRSPDPAPEPEPAAEEARVQPLFRMTTTRNDLSYNASGPDVLGALMETIAEYREVPLAGVQ